MSNKNVNYQQNHDGESVNSLKGTMISVFVVVGGVILFTYAVLYGLFMTRL